ncbi:uncharacterized protein LOC110108009 [Dendrobium catenatum]|uniref:Transmembrane protein n=1 Tax=Dendrobium catenatum TaxID=906689 RepID=A0A2I0WF63_9ASPA|nr:uncharacterized protein LOC110108009 [Dendrobium catenatum]PKU74314.1 hypothetical protein MA16_Dca003517 [Dendrobium catenatum]
MAKAFKEMVFEWEYLHPKGSVTNEQELSPTELIPVADKKLEDELKEEEIYEEQAVFSEQNLVRDEVLAVEEEIGSHENEEETDWGLQSLLFREEEEEDSKMVEFKDPNIKEKDNFEAFKLKKWLSSVIMAAATISIFIFGGGRVELTGKRKNIQSAILKKENVKDIFVQHQQAASASFSLSGHYDERF